MTKKLYTQTRARLVAELAEAEATVATLTQKIKALDLVYHEILHEPIDDGPPQEDMGPAIQKEDGSAAATSSQGTKPVIGELIRDVVVGLEDRFDVPRVVALIRAKYPGVSELEINRTTVSGRLRRMADAGELALVSKGSGRSPSTYRNARPFADRLVVLRAATDGGLNETAALRGG